MPSAMKRALRTLEIVLYVAFLADCFLLIAGGARQDYFPTGGVSLIVILVLVGIVQRLRGGKHYIDESF